MLSFKTSVFESNGVWWFKWWNISPGPAYLAQDLIGPCKDQQDAEAEQQRFMLAEKKRHPLATFELL